MSEKVGSWPEDRSRVLTAARLGWAMAEARGQLREAAARTAPADHGTRKWLPLGSERSETERLVEYAAVLGGLANPLGVNFSAKEITGGRFKVDRPTWEWLKSATFDLLRARDAQAPLEPATKQVSDIFYAWDAKIQDTLGADPALSAAYQLGRGVAEIRWGCNLAVADDDSRTIRSHLLGKARGAEIDRLLARLAEYYDPVTHHAIASSIQRWRKLTVDLVDAPDEAWRDAFRAQATNWHDLILGQRDGSSFVSPQDILAKPSSLLSIAKHLAPEVVITAIGAALLVVAAAWLATPGAEERVAAVAGVIGLVGVTAAGISAKARASAVNLIATVREELYLALVADKAVVLPPGAEATEANA